MPQRLQGSKVHKDKFSPVPESMEKIGKLVVDAAKIKDGIRRFIV